MHSFTAPPTSIGAWRYTNASLTAPSSGSYNDRVSRRDSLRRRSDRGAGPTLSFIYEDFDIDLVGSRHSLGERTIRSALDHLLRLGMISVMPDDVSSAPRLQVSPVAEIAAHMRRTQLADAQPVARSTAGEADLAVAEGSQLDVEMHCHLGEGMAVPSSGQVSLEVLADPSPGSSSAGGAALVVGYDFATERLFVDHARMGNATILQTAPLPRAHLPLAAGGAPLIRVLVDNAMIESFGGGEVALTSFVTPTGDAAPEARVARAGKSGDGVACTVSAWVLGL